MNELKILDNLIKHFKANQRIDVIMEILRMRKEFLRDERIVKEGNEALVNAEYIQAMKEVK